MFKKKGLLIETSVSSKILLRNYKMIKGIGNTFSSSFCMAPCGLTDIFNHNNNHGCFDSLQIERAKFKKENYKNLINRGVKNHYKKNFIKPVGCLSSLNVQNIYNVKYNFFEYGQTAISATLRHSKSHKGYAFQFFQKNGPLALLPMSNKRGSNYSSLVWTEKTDNISSLISSKKNLEDCLNNLCSDYLGKISISKGPSSFVLKKLSGVKALSNGALFVGDALRAMHPMAGQAWNQSLRDIAYIADAFAESEKLGLDLFQCPSISLFNKKRKIETEALINSIGFLNSIYRSDTSLAKGLRRNIMKLADNYKPLKLFLLNEASGGALERPNLLNGLKPGSNII